MEDVRTTPDNPLELDSVSREFQTLYDRAARISILPAHGRYNLTISDEKKFVWFRVAKAGSRTILHHFRTSDVPLSADHAMGVRYPPSLYKEYFKFAFVRNPWDRLVSCWHDKVVESNYFNFSAEKRQDLQAFERFVEEVAGFDLEDCDPHLRLQCRLIDLSSIDYLGRLERFDADFKAICRELGISALSVEPRNVSKNRNPYQEYYDAELRDRVSRIYRRDVQIFNYGFDEIDRTVVAPRVSIPAGEAGSEAGGEADGAYRLSPSFVVGAFDDQVLLYDLNRDRPLALSPTAGLILGLLDGSRSAADIRALLQQAYPESAQDVARDVDATLARLHQHQALLAEVVVSDAEVAAAPDVLISGMGRSGTTWLAELINYDGFYFPIFEPFHPEAPTPHGFIPWQVLAPDEQARELAADAERILSGPPGLAKPRLIKAIRVNMMLKWLRNLRPDMSVIVLVRHPLAVVRSRLRMGWAIEASNPMFSHEGLRRDFPRLDAAFRDPAAMDDFERTVLHWGAQHHVLFSQLEPGDSHLVFYENLVLRAERELSSIFAYLGRRLDLTAARGRFTKSSRTNYLKTSQDDRKALVGGWRRHFDPGQVRRAIEILEPLGLGDLYRPDGRPRDETSGALAERLARRFRATKATTGQ